jgi:hypothetical protein
LSLFKVQGQQLLQQLLACRSLILIQVIGQSTQIRFYVDIITGGDIFNGTALLFTALF